MRIFTEKKQVISEIKRDLYEMGQNVSTMSMQNKIAKTKDEFETKEICNYSFCLSDLENIKELLNYQEFIDAELVKIEKYFKNDGEKKNYLDYIKTKYNLDVDLKNPLSILELWIDKDFGERISIDQNPGDAWKIRPWVWETFLVDGKFDYSYSERIHIDDYIDQIKKNPFGRQYIYNIWDRGDREVIGGKKRVPCSLFYQVLIRDSGEINDNMEPIYSLDLIYTMRSCDFLTHFPIDIIQATNLMKKIKEKININGLRIGKLYYNCSSLHFYKKDLKENVF